MRAAAVLLLSTLTLEDEGRVNASGSVIDESTKLPIPNATVLVHSAGVKTGYDLFCRTCYAVSGKRALTNEKGELTIPNLDSDLVFNLLLVREGYGASFLKKIDPANGGQWFCSPCSAALRLCLR